MVARTTGELTVIFIFLWFADKILFFFFSHKNNNLHFTIQFTCTHQFWVYSLFFLFCSESEHSFHSQIWKIYYFRCSYARIHFSLHTHWIYIRWYYVCFSSAIHKDCANNQCLSINLKHECVTANCESDGNFRQTHIDRFCM